MSSASWSRAFTLEITLAGEVTASIHPLLERAMQDTARVRAELGSLRDLLETQLSSLIWNDLERRQPMRAQRSCRSRPGLKPQASARCRASRNARARDAGS